MDSKNLLLSDVNSLQCVNTSFAYGLLYITIFVHLGPVVQSIVSLTSLFVVKM